MIYDSGLRNHLTPPPPPENFSDPRKLPSSRKQNYSLKPPWKISAYKHVRSDSLALAFN